MTSTYGVIFFRDLVAGVSFNLIYLNLDNNKKNLVAYKKHSFRSSQKLSCKKTCLDICLNKTSHVCDHLTTLCFSLTTTAANFKPCALYTITWAL